MIQQETKLKIVDNTGGKEASCIKVLGGSGRRYAALGDIIVVSVTKAAPRSSARRGRVYRERTPPPDRAAPSRTGPTSGCFHGPKCLPGSSYRAARPAGRGTGSRRPT